MMQIKKTNRSNIATPRECQARIDLNNDVVQRYLEMYRDGETLPPLSVIKYCDGESKYVLWDGYHRFEALKSIYEFYEDKIEVDVTDEGADFYEARRKAQLLAIGANAEHGLQRTNADKRKAVEMLLDDPEWCEWSDRQVAKAARVSHTYVANIRKERTPSICDARGNELVAGDFVVYTPPLSGLTPHTLYAIVEGGADGMIDITAWDPELGTIEEYGRKVSCPRDCICKTEKLPDDLDNADRYLLRGLPEDVRAATLKYKAENPDQSVFASMRAARKAMESEETTNDGNVATGGDSTEFVDGGDSPVHFDDGADSYVFAGAGLGGNTFMSFRLPKHDAGSRHRVKSSSLPTRDTLEEAEEDLVTYAQGKDWELWEPDHAMFQAAKTIKARLSRDNCDETTKPALTPDPDNTHDWKTWVMTATESLEKLTRAKHPLPYHRLTELVASLMQDTSTRNEIHRMAYQMGADAATRGKGEACPFANVLRGHWFDGFEENTKENTTESGEERPEPEIPESVWRNAAKLHEAFELCLLVMASDQKTIWQLYPESKSLEIVHQDKTKAGAKREFESLLATDGYDMRRLSPAGEMIRARKRDNYPVSKSDSMTYAIHTSPNWSLMEHPETGAPLKFDTKAERDAAWQEFVIDNPNALED